MNLQPLRHLVLSTLLAFCVYIPQANAWRLPDGASLALGTGHPDDLRGIRVAQQWHWPKHWFADHAFDLRGYWDTSLALWKTEGNAEHRNRALAIGAIAPVFRIQGTAHLSEYFSPYLQASVGLSLISRTHLGHRNLGKNWQFQDLLGLGVQFGHKKAWDLGIHYLHYSNAGINPPNQGIDVKLLVMLMYHGEQIS